ncbi:thiamine ABC transporter ATP-binding protein [Psychromonas sp. KJ10-10]|uniref:thiamine ABC transporter ATP-binding protein n=1 Tax=Psychromonas sp. KJ10-10 TaxID=3391823 RepID=UPI0039B37B54
MIKFNNIKYQYQAQDFCFDFNIDSGSLVAILGESGAGKSTLLNLAAGFISPIEGDICIDNNSVINVAPHLRPLSMLFQEQNLFAHLKVVDNIGIGLNPGLKLSSSQSQSILDICQQLGIDDLLERFPEQLSGGQKQRVALARCFVQNKPLLLLDEPFSALDPVLRTEMLAIVKELAHVNKVTVLMVTHHIADALSVASHFVFIEQGNCTAVEKISVLNNLHINSKLCQFVEAGL